MTLKETLQNAAGRLGAVSDSTVLDAEMLLAWVMGKPRSYVIAHGDDQLDAANSERFAQAIQRRAEGEPVAYIIGEKEFWSLPIKVTNASLVPRPETELLVELALGFIAPDQALKILDLGTGSGAIALAIVSERPKCSVIGIDNSAAAVALASDNARRLSLPGTQFMLGNWTEPVTGSRFDLIVSNPPYVHPADPALAALVHEPQAALVGGADGLAAIRHIARQSGQCLTPGGHLLLEHGADQADAVHAILERNGWTNIRCHRDLAGQPRVTVACLGAQDCATSK